MRRRIVVVGDVLLDVDLDGAAHRLCPDAPAPVVEAPHERARPGGAGLAAWMLSRDGHAVTLVTAPGDGPAGRRLRRLLAACGITVVDVGGAGAAVEKMRVRAGGQVLVRVDRGAPAPVAAVPAAAHEAVRGADAVLVSDYGNGVAADAGVRALIAAAAVPVVWDPHPRGPVPPSGVDLITPNAAEAAGLPGGGDPEGVRTTLGVRAVAVTRGPAGALVADGAGPCVTVPSGGEVHGDALGAGDRFAATAAAVLADGGDVAAAVTAAVRSATRFVATGGVAAMGPPGRPPWAVSGVDTDVQAIVRAARAGGGTVVATGGCFDLLHAGHVASLEAARSLGDCLVVLLNSDASVRRLKGPDRPVVGQRDRARVLRGLRAVDAVLVFDEDDPCAALERVAPDVFAKGADHDPDRMPETDVMRRLGGRVVALPFVAGRSTTRLISEVTSRVRH